MGPWKGGSDDLRPRQKYFDLAKNVVKLYDLAKLFLEFIDLAKIKRNDLAKFISV